jgi:hypothetical protein
VPGRVPKRWVRRHPKTPFAQGSDDPPLAPTSPSPGPHTTAPSLPASRSGQWSWRQLINTLFHRLPVHSWNFNPRNFPPRSPTHELASYGPFRPRRVYGTCTRQRPTTCAGPARIRSRPWLPKEASSTFLETTSRSLAGPSYVFRSEPRPECSDTFQPKRPRETVAPGRPIFSLRGRGE